MKYYIRVSLKYHLYLFPFSFQMASQLRASFRVATVSHCRNFLSILWADGRKSKFSNIWLRASVRDSKFFDASSLLYRQKDYVSFIAKDVPLTSAEYVQEEEDLTVQWENHTSNFNASWLRAQDQVNNEDLCQGTDRVLWDASSKLPVMYHYSEREEKFESWLTDLRRYGVAYFEGVPPKEKGMEDVLQLIGVMRQRFHPTNKLLITHDPKLTKKIDVDIYNNDPHPVHTDTAYYSTPLRISCLLATHYHAPVQNTYNYFVDSLKVIEDIHRENPEAYTLLSTIPVRITRRRMNVQEECDPSDVRMYQYDAFIETPLICYDEAEQHLFLRFSNKHSGFEISTIPDHSIMEKYYKAFLLLESKLSDPTYHQKIVLKAGAMALFNNNRVCHSRSAIHPSTSRSLFLGFMSEEMWRTRWRVMLGEKSGLDEKWLYGCSQEALQILANRLELVEKEIFTPAKLSVAK